MVNLNTFFECFFVSTLQTDQGIKNLMADQADRLASEDPDYAIRDLYNAIANKNFPSWTMHIQVKSATIFF